MFAVVLAGGTSRRFGSDKLDHAWDGHSLLDHALSALPADWPVIVVGPDRLVSRPVTFIREEPAGGGPAAALAAGIQEAWLRDADVVVTIPGDAPESGRGAEHLVETLLAGRADAAVALDRTGIPQPLQLALRGDALDRLAELDPDLVHQSSARCLLEMVHPVQVPLPDAWTTDIDTPEQLETWLKA